MVVDISKQMTFPDAIGFKARQALVDESSANASASERRAYRQMMQKPSSAVVAAKYSPYNRFADCGDPAESRVSLQVKADIVAGVGFT